MPVNFNFTPLQYPDIGKSLDSVFDYFLQNKIADRNFQVQQQEMQRSQQQMALQQQQMNALRAQGMLQGAPFGMNFNDPNQVEQGLQDYQRGQQGFNQAPPMLQNPQGPQYQSQYGQGMGQYIGMQRNSAAMDVLKRQSEIGSQQAEANSKNATAALDTLKYNLVGGNGGVNGNVLSDTAQRYGNRQIPGEDLFDATGRDPLLRLGLQNQINKLGINQQQIKNEQTTQDAQAKVRGDAGQKVGSLAGTLEDVLNQAEPLIKQLNTSQFKLLNDAWNKGLASVNDEKTNEALSYMNEARGLYSSVLSNGNAAGEAEKQMAQESIGRGLSSSGFKGMKKAVTFAATSKVKRLTGQGFNEPAPKVEAQANASFSSPQDVKQAVKNGSLSVPEAKQILQAKFGFK